MMGTGLYTKFDMFSLFNLNKQYFRWQRFFGHPWLDIFKRLYSTYSVTWNFQIEMNMLKSKFSKFKILADQLKIHRLIVEFPLPIYTLFESLLDWLAWIFIWMSAILRIPSNLNKKAFYTVPFIQSGGN